MVNTLERVDTAALPAAVVEAASAILAKAATVAADLTITDALRHGERETASPLVVVDRVLAAHTATNAVVLCGGYTTEAMRYPNIRVNAIHRAFRLVSGAES